MNSENFKTAGSSSKNITGVIFLLAGVVMLAKSLVPEIGIPDWLISWPMLLIVLGIVSGVKHRFRRAGAYFSIAIGLAFLVERISDTVEFHHLIFPAVILATGLHLMFGRQKVCYNQHPQ